MAQHASPSKPNENFQEVLPGLVLVASAGCAIAILNSPWGPLHTALLKTDFGLAWGDAVLSMPLSSWIKNALMSVFFLFAGLELKRELKEGALSRPRDAAVPVIAAVGGMALPGLVYLAFAGYPPYANGWAIPAATDIAFALGVLSLLGSLVPARLKAFLLAVAVVDDLGAILIVAFFYSGGVDWGWLAWAGGWCAVLLGLNLARMRHPALYLFPGLCLWLCLQNSGVNPTLGGVLLALAVPLRDRRGGSPLHDAEHALRPWVLFGIMPIFALANGGIVLREGFLEGLAHPVALGVAAGLLVGKPLGILGATLLGARLVKAPLPGSWPQILGMGFIAGIGFTMSLFISALAFGDPAIEEYARVGIYLGSVTAAVLGLLILVVTLKREPGADTAEDPARPFIAPERAYEEVPDAAGRASPVRVYQPAPEAPAPSKGTA